MGIGTKASSTHLKPLVEESTVESRKSFSTERGTGVHQPTGDRRGEKGFIFSNRSKEQGPGILSSCYQLREA